MQQSLSRFLGVLDYDAHPHGLLEARQCLIDSIKLSVRAKPLSFYRYLPHSQSPKRMLNIEARCNCYFSISQILNTIMSRLSERKQLGPK
jgi:tubulin-specific chaperone D